MMDNIDKNIKATSTIEEDEINLVELFKRLWQKRRFLFIITGCFFALGLLVAIFTPKEYNASCVFVPQGYNKNISGSINSMAAMAGLSIGNGNTSGDISPDVYPQVMDNIDLKKELINSEFYFKKFDKKLTLLDYYTNKKYKQFSLFGTIRKYTLGLPGVILNAFRKDQDHKDDISIYSSVPYVNLTLEESRCVNKMNDNVKMDVVLKGGYISLTAKMPEAIAAAEVVGKSFDLLQKYVTKFRLEKAKSDYNYIKARCDDAEADYSAKQSAYAHYLDANRVVSTAIAMTKQEKLEREYDLANSIYNELSRQLMNAELKVTEDTPILTVIKPVVVPRIASKPKRLKIVLLWTFLGLIVSGGLVFGFDHLKNNTQLDWPKKWS
ncbi:MAG: Wzz/FepE/Etk N-terminal domain-containing protein [Bacteroidales bacterium]|nr:Wzz/FepE/Etk N-terminal domain-containing protein [Bacteroidales bacterium]